MKYITLSLLLAATLLTACQKDEEVDIPTCVNCSFTCLEADEPNVYTNDCVDNWTCSYAVQSQSKVDTDEYEGVAEGVKNVFQVVLDTDGAMEIADDELTIILAFELEESQNSFSVEEEGLESMRVAYRRVCFCTEVDFKSVDAGCLQGEKQSDGSWFVQGNLTIPYSFGDVPFKFDARFEEI